MNKAILKSAALAIAFGSVLTLSACNVEKTQEGEMPEVDVNAKGGELPAYDVETADVDVNSQPATVTVPDVDVSTEEKTVSVPDVDVNMPQENDAAEEAPAQ